MSPSNLALASTILLSTGCALLLETNQSSSRPGTAAGSRPNPADWNIFFISGCAPDANREGKEDKQGREALANKGFGTPRENVFSIWHKAAKKRDRNIFVEAGTYSRQAYSGEWWAGVEFPYKGLTGAEYAKNSNYWLGHWNKWQTKHQFKKSLGDLCTNLGQFPNPTEEEAKAGVYGSNGFKESDGQNIYQINYYFVPEVMENSKPKAHNGILIISSHGNLKGEVTFGGAMKANALNDLIRDGYGSAKMPHYIIILSCGAGQGEGMIQELAFRTQAAVFVSKFIIGRSGSMPQMTWGLSGGDPTEWALREEFGNDGDPLHIGRTFCGKLGLEFGSNDKSHWESMKAEDEDGVDEGFVSYFDVGLMERDPFYFTWSNKNGDKALPDGWVEDCKSRWKHTIPTQCQSPAPKQQQVCAQMRAKNKRKEGQNWNTPYGHLDTEIQQSVFGPAQPASTDPGLPEWVAPSGLPTCQDGLCTGGTDDVPVSTDRSDIDT